MNELKPCPFCGRSTCTACRDNVAYFDELDKIVFCQCGACGPNKATEAEAIAAWNTRPEPPTEIPRSDAEASADLSNDGPLGTGVGASVSASGTDEALVNLPVDSGINAESVERAEFLWANLPTMRKWTSLATHEKALVCHLLDRELSTSKAKLEAAEEMAEAPVWQFLLGEGPLFGCHFGENPVNERGNFWWRKHLRAALAKWERANGTD